MNLHEYQAKSLFAEYGLPVSPGIAADNAQAAVAAAGEIGGDRWAVKVQVHAGGRGKAGGVKVAELTRHEFRALLMAQRHEQVDNARLRAATGLDTLGASQLLRGLRDRELLTLHSHGAASYYTLSPALCEQIGRRSAADRGELGSDRGEFAERIDDTSARIEGSSGSDRGDLGSDRGELPADVRSMIDRLGSRPRKERLRAAIEAICMAREWTTSGEMSRFLRFSQRNLTSRHLTPMVEAGQLARCYPDSPNHPEQAYRARRQLVDS